MAHLAIIYQYTVARALVGDACTITVRNNRGLKVREAHSGADGLPHIHAHKIIMADLAKTNELWDVCVSEDYFTGHYIFTAIPKDCATIQSVALDLLNVVIEGYEESKEALQIENMEREQLLEEHAGLLDAAQEALAYIKERTQGVALDVKDSLRAAIRAAGGEV